MRVKVATNVVIVVVVVDINDVIVIAVVVIVIVVAVVVVVLKQKDANNYLLRNGPAQRKNLQGSVYSGASLVLRPNSRYL